MDRYLVRLEAKSTSSIPASGNASSVPVCCAHRQDCHSCIQDQKVLFSNLCSSGGRLTPQKAHDVMLDYFEWNISMHELVHNLRTVVKYDPHLTSQFRCDCLLLLDTVCINSICCTFSDLLNCVWKDGEFQAQSPGDFGPVFEQVEFRLVHGLKMLETVNSDLLLINRTSYSDKASLMLMCRYLRIESLACFYQKGRFLRSHRLKPVDFGLGFTCTYYLQRPVFHHISIYLRFGHNAREGQRLDLTKMDEVIGLSATEDDNSINVDCGICYGAVSGSASDKARPCLMSRPCCNKAWHPECMFMWVKSNNTCPYCRHVWDTNFQGEVSNKYLEALQFHLRMISRHNRILGKPAQLRQTTVLQYLQAN